jgi:hypothetical protein
MIRLKDEEEFLYPSVKSVIELVDEVVLVDNLSSDRTPAIMQDLQREYPAKVACYSYAYEIRRRGREHYELASTPEGRSSPHLSSNYYNWCLQKCTKPYVLKWDGDMIATDALGEYVDQWRGMHKAVLRLRGANVHPDRLHLAASKSTDADQLAESMPVHRIPRWLTSMGYTYPEARVFPRFGARYGTGVWWTQTLSSPYTSRCVADIFALRVQEPCFLHVKFCKHDPFTGYSAEFVEMLASNLTLGPPLREDWQELLRRWHLL